MSNIAAGFLVSLTLQALEEQPRSSWSLRRSIAEPEISAIALEPS